MPPTEKSSADRTLIRVRIGCVSTARRSAWHSGGGKGGSHRFTRTLPRKWRERYSRISARDKEPYSSFRESSAFSIRPKGSRSSIVLAASTSRETT